MVTIDAPLSGQPICGRLAALAILRRERFGPKQETLATSGKREVGAGVEGLHCAVHVIHARQCAGVEQSRNVQSIRRYTERV